MFSLDLTTWLYKPSIHTSPLARTALPACHHRQTGASSATVSRYTYEIARDRDLDTDSTEDQYWHIVRLDDADDRPHLHTLCNRSLEEPVTRWRDYSVERMVDIICHQCLTGYVAEAGSQAG
jgi:hypothetical protein